MNLALITSLIGAAAGFGLAWQLQAHQITKMELQNANERIAVARATRATLERNQSQIATAQAAAAKRNVRIRTAAGAAGDAGNGLRITSTATVRSAEADPSSCNSIIAAYSAMVTTGSEFIQEVARDADQCHSDLQLMTDAWTKQ